MNGRLTFKPLATLEKNPARVLVKKRALDVHRLYKNTAKKKAGGRPRESAEGSARRSISLPVALWRKLDVAAAQRGLSMSAFIRIACKRDLVAERYRPKKTKDLFPMRFT